MRDAARRSFGWDVVLVLQLTHSGRYSKPTGVPKPLIAHRSPILDPIHRLAPDYPVVSDEYLDRLQDTFLQASRLAADAGFDGVDVKSCHRYLVSELLASFTREGRYGGTFENRARFLIETLTRIRLDVPGVFVTTRMNAFDGIPHPYGFGVDREDGGTPDLTEPLALVGRLRELGIPVLNVSIGNPYFNPHYGRPFDFPVQGMRAPDEHPLVGLSRFMGITRRIQDAFSGLPVVGSGYSWLRQFVPYVASGVVQSHGATLIGLGREAFAYPDAVKDIQETGRMDPARCCVACSACSQIMRDGAMTGCVVRDSEIYGPQYRLGRRFALDRLQEEARRCRECEEPTCVRNCPAHVRIPAFIKAFADGDFKLAYEVLRESNALPEMCPVEVQCEAGCLETIFCERPVAIGDIQLVTCRIARREGYTGVRLPQKSTGRKVAVVGGGPAGVACAIRLLESGHEVTILDQGSRLGGTPDDMIPFDRYESAQSEVDAILSPGDRAGRLSVHFGRALGRDISLAALRDNYDAVLLAAGLGGSKSLGHAPAGVMDAPIFLRTAKAGLLKSIPGRVAVIGGGNTAVDAAATARRMGAVDVFLIYRRSLAEMPAWPKEREAFTARGGHLLILTQPLGYAAGEDGRLTGLRIARTELGEPDASGRRGPRIVPDSESVLKVDLVVEALGQALTEDLKSALKDVALTDDGLVRTAPDSCATSLPGIFAAGDIVNGGTTAVQAVADGMKAATEIDAFMQTEARPRSRE